MTRLLTCGYETGDINELGTSSIGASGAQAVATSTPTPRSGTYCLKCTGGFTGAQSYKSFSLGGNKTDVWLRFGLFIHATTTAEVVFATYRDAGSTAQVCLTYATSDSLIRARQGTAGQVGDASGTLVGTASLTMSADAWHLVEWRHQMTSATVGITEVWLDGTRVINVSGDNSFTATINVASLLLGVLRQDVGSGYYMALDDLAINDTSGSINNGQIGDGRVALLVPNGAGSSTVLTRGGTDTGANWNQTSELPPSMTQYVLSATAADRDLYAMSNIGVSVASINVVEELVLALNSDAGAGSIGLTVKSGGTTNEGTAQSLGTTAAYYRQQYETDPATSAAWNLSGVNAIEAGITVR